MSPVAIAATLAALFVLSIAVRRLACARGHHRLNPRTATCDVCGKTWEELRRGR